MKLGTTLRTLPRQVVYIVGNEAAERFSYYGMTAVLTLFLTESMEYSKRDSEAIYHLFTAAVYVLPLAGAFIADRYWGKYNTIVRLSIVYVIGHAFLAIFEGTPLGLALGLGCIAIGAGGIKPCVSTHLGDQFADKTQLSLAFPLFYFAINVGAIASQLATPYLRVHWGYSWAFGVPGLLMALALLVFWIGRKHYVVVAPIHRPDTPGRVLWRALTRGWSQAQLDYSPAAVAQARSVARIVLVLSPCIVFWALFMQTGSSWVLLTTQLRLPSWLLPDQLQVANGALILILLPTFSAFLVPFMAKRGRLIAPIAKMKVGMFVCALSFVPVAILQALVDAGFVPSALWMLIPYFILTASEILVSVFALEFAYAEAPMSAKSTMMGIWYLNIGCGNLLNVAIGYAPLGGAARFLLWTGLMLAAATAFNLGAARYLRPAQTPLMGQR